MTQQEALNILKLGHNVFLTGAAGTGKTYVLNEFIRYLRSYSIPHIVTASTGLAATHVGGVTVHAFSGIGIKDKLSSWDIDMLAQNEKLNKRVNNIQVMIIDEISMLHASRLDMVDKIFKKVRKDNRPFGGVQMIFCGDFFQLPPVIRKDELQKNTKEGNGRTQESEYAFNSNTWKEAKPVICYLTENFRQEDNTLTNILNMIRSANEDIYESLESLNDTRENELINPIKLYSHNKDVDTINLKHYCELDNDECEVEFVAVAKGRKNLVDNLKASILAMENIKLKKGTKVLFIKNDKMGNYQNGTLGIVDAFDKDNYPIILTNAGERITAKEDVWQLKDEDENVLAEVSQLPLRYAWAITVHKSQGMTLDEAEIDLTQGFGFGMGYVALSRVRSLSGLKLHGLNNQALLVANNVLLFDKELKERSKKAREALKKYEEQELENLKRETRTRMGGLETALSSEELEKKKEENKLKEKEVKVPTQAITFQLIRGGKNIKQIAEERKLTEGTIISHIVEIKSLPSFDNDLEVKKLVEDIANKYLDSYIEENKIDKKILTKKLIQEIAEDLKTETKLTPVLTKYKSKYKDLNYELLKIISLF